MGASSPITMKNSIFPLRDIIRQNVSNADFENAVLQLFRYQYENNKVYASYVNALNINASGISKLEEIPYLPIFFFKSHVVICDETAQAGQNNSFEQVFQSSTTTTGIPSRHFVKDIGLYEDSFSKGFELFYGDISKYCLLALLPSYLEKGDSSLVYMVNKLIKDTQNPDSGFYMHNYEELAYKLRQNEAKGQQTFLIGVTYALLKLAEEYPMELKNTIIMETGGMKGRREELMKQEVHQILMDAFKAKVVHSEYGMTELLSQGYSKGNGLFQCVPWMRVLIRDIYDPFHTGLVNETGAINIIDLANIYSCSFIATDDIGITFPNGDFEVSGRLDSSDIRGCNIMAAEL
jgi:phenylacetate-coenzyme A ligase PaaK-like adenylate-forming protein